MSDAFENGFIIDLSSAKNTSEIITELSDILEMPEAKNKEICLKIGKIALSQSQLLSIKSLIESMGSNLAFIDTKSKKTKETATELGIVISTLTNKIKVEEPEKKQEEKSEIPAKEDVKEVVEQTEQTEEETIETAEVKEIKEDKETVVVEEVVDCVEAKNSEELEEYSNYTHNVKEDNSIKANEKNSYELVMEKPLDKEDLPEIEEIEEINEDLEVDEEDIEDEEISVSEKEAKAELSKLPTLYLQQNLRSGQTMSYDGNIVIIGDTNAGSEIVAKGDITVWGILGGIAHAGARGNHYAKIRALKLNAIQLRISGYYARRPDTANSLYIQRSSQFVPEEASVSDGAIVIKKMNE